jgi:hypothetical protein
MTAKAFPRQTLILEIMGVCLLILIVGLALFYQFTGWKLGGLDLLFACVFIINYVNLFRSHLSQVGSYRRVGNKLATSGATDV